MKGDGDSENGEKWKIKVTYLYILKLRYNSRAIRFTISKCVIQWFLIYSQS